MISIIAMFSNYSGSCPSITWRPPLFVYIVWIVPLRAISLACLTICLPKKEYQ